jgi:hypothetical protein
MLKKGMDKWILQSNSIRHYKVCPLKDFFFVSMSNSQNFPSVFGGHLISMNIPPTKEE